MPFLVGLPAQLLPQLKHVPMDEVTTIDLDLQRWACGVGWCSHWLLCTCCWLHV